MNIPRYCTKQSPSDGGPPLLTFSNNLPPHEIITTLQKPLCAGSYFAACVSFLFLRVGLVTSDSSACATGTKLYRGRAAAELLMGGNLVLCKAVARGGYSCSAAWSLCQDS